MKIKIIDSAGQVFVSDDLGHEFEDMHDLRKLLGQHLGAQFFAAEINGEVVIFGTAHIRRIERMAQS
jgi:hypothetical protein